jgi:hypothetical protein
MRYDTASGQEQILWQIAGEDFDDDRYFSISANGQLYAHWNEISYDDKVLRIHDASGQELKHYYLVIASPIRTDPLQIRCYSSQHRMPHNISTSALTDRNFCSPCPGAFSGA